MLELVCMLAPVDSVDAIRLATIRQLPEFARAKPEEILRIPVSPSGAAPATHWFCAYSVTPEEKAKIEASIVAEPVCEVLIVTYGIRPRAYLDQQGLQIIGNKTLNRGQV